MYIADWTHWQGGPAPARQIEGEGFGAIKMKVGGATREGWSFIDPVFERSALAVAGTQLVPFGYWYLVPGMPIAQCGLYVDTLRKNNWKKSGHLDGWVCQLDVEQSGLGPSDVANFLQAWGDLTNDYPISVYTNATLWKKCTQNAVDGSSYTMFLEEAHWVSDAIRNAEDKPYASHHFRGVQESWWDVDYGGWDKAVMLQFTNRALVAGKRVPCSYFKGDKDAFRSLFTR